MMLLVVGSMSCIAPQRVARAEEVEQNANDKSYFTDVTTGETSSVSVEKTEGENEEVRVSYGNMFSPTGILTGENSSVSARAILGNDNRWKVPDATATPYAAVGLVEVTYTNGWVSRGTGFMVSSKTMLTAAHNIVEKDLVVKKNRGLFEKKQIL